MPLEWGKINETDYGAATRDFMIIAYEDNGSWKWIAMLNDGSYEPAGDSGDAQLADAQAAMDAAVAWASD